MDEYIKKLHKDRDSILRFCGIHQAIYLYGTGGVAASFAQYLDEESIEYVGFLVSNGHKKCNVYKGKSVFEIGEIDLKDAGIILSVPEKYHDEIIDSLYKHGRCAESSIYKQRVYYPISDNEILPEDAYTGVSKSGEYFRQYRELDNLGLNTGTDKSSTKHNYLDKYEMFLKLLKGKRICLLEIGVFNGESLQMWKRYFDNSTIVGIDIDEECKKYENDGIVVEIQDMSVVDNIDDIGKKYSPDIIIEDASHLWSHQIKSLITLLPHMKSGGIYIMEDIGTSFGKYRKSLYADATVSGYEFMRALSDMVSGGEIITNTDFPDELYHEVEKLTKMIDMISFIYGSAIVVKK